LTDVKKSLRALNGGETRLRRVPAICPGYEGITEIFEVGSTIDMLAVGSKRVIVDRIPASESAGGLPGGRSYPGRIEMTACIREIWDDGYIEVTVPLTPPIQARSPVGDTWILVLIAEEMGALRLPKA